MIGADPGPTTGPQIDLEDCVLVQDTSSVGAAAPPDTIFCPATVGSWQNFGANVGVPRKGQLLLAFFPPNDGSAGDPPPQSFIGTVDPGNSGSVRAFIRTMRRLYPDVNGVTLQGQPPPNSGVIVDPIVQDVTLSLDSESQCTTALRNLLTLIDPGTAGGDLLDLNQFLTFNEKLRLVSCRSIP